MKTKVTLKLKVGDGKIATQLLQYWYKKREIATNRIMDALVMPGFQHEVAYKSQISLYGQTMMKQPTLRGSGKVAWTYLALPSSLGVAKMLGLTRKYFLQTSGHGKSGYPYGHYIRTGEMMRNLVRSMYEFKRYAIKGAMSKAFSCKAKAILRPRQAVSKFGWKLKYAYDKRGQEYMEKVVAGVVRETWMHLTKTDTGNFANSLFCTRLFE